jgi:hypothetical protein
MAYQIRFQRKAKSNTRRVMASISGGCFLEGYCLASEHTRRRHEPGSPRPRSSYMNPSSLYDAWRKPP